MPQQLAVTPEGLDSLFFWDDYLHEQARRGPGRAAEPDH
ncbi:hypothetical protein FHR97_001610 [Halomonas stenophila]|uniref:Uncharacterized protein n=1 Tax=Halomonas stenophila TaxID=795312 RepID=A0A7W5EU59_9GAMM|nr:hypothetical protein [Halomonas stenophila]